MKSQRVADDLRADANLEESARGSYLHERADTAVATYKGVENGQRVYIDVQDLSGVDLCLKKLVVTYYFNIVTAN